MEVNKKELIHILLLFLNFCDKSAECELTILEFQGKEKEIINDFISTFYIDNITHWMPLPDLPVDEPIQDDCYEFGHIWTWMPNQSYCIRCGIIKNHNEKE